jgi:hypothetical protein
VTRSQKNVYGGALMTLKATLGWCANGSNVQSATWNYSTSTGFGWSFDKWQLPPTVYFNYPSNTAVRVFNPHGSLAVAFAVLLHVHQLLPQVAVGLVPLLRTSFPTNSRSLSLDP